MRSPRRTLPACVALLAIALLAARASAADGDPSATAPLRLLVQADARLASQPDPAHDPQDAPAGAAIRLRRVRVGDDVGYGDFRLRVLFEAQPETAAGAAFPPLAGGRLPFGGPVRATEVGATWAPVRGFQLTAGMLRVPFSLSRQVDEGDLRLPERPAFVDAFLPDFRAGVSVGGDLGELLYDVAVMSAATTLDGRLFDHGALVAGRLVAEPLGPVGLAPWRRAAADPWYGWFRFAAGLSVLYGSVAAPDTLALDPDLTVQWKALVVTAEYLFSVRYGHGTEVVPGSTEQGAALAPGVTLFARRLDLVARGDWQHAGSANVWGAGAGLTAYAPDPRVRLNAGFERRWTQPRPAPGAPDAAASWWALVRLAIVVD